MEPMTTPATADDDAVALQHAFRQLCGEYEELADEASNGTQPIDERIGLALFKIDEACAVTDVVREDAAQAQEQLMEALIENCHELEDVFLRINIMERFVGKVQEATRELEKRMENINRAAGPVFNAGSVTSLLRSFSKRVTVSEPSASEVTKWEPMEFDFNTKELMTRLENGDARELGVSISSNERPPSSTATGSSASFVSAMASFSQLLPNVPDLRAQP
ncbi:hypothetical protein FI667_g5011, partial [Globisporangium splendens]